MVQQHKECFLLDGIGIKNIQNERRDMSKKDGLEFTQRKARKVSSQSEPWQPNDFTTGCGQEASRPMQIGEVVGL